MKINLKGTSLSITSEISDYLNKRIEGIEKFLPDDRDSYIIDVELGKTTNHHNAGDIFRAEININVGGKTLRAVSERSDLFSAIDDMKDEINHELASFKGKRVSIIRKSGQKLKEMIRKFYR